MFIAFALSSFPFLIGPLKTNWWVKPILGFNILIQFTLWGWRAAKGWNLFRDE